MLTVMKIALPSNPIVASISRVLKSYFHAFKNHMRSLAQPNIKNGLKSYNINPGVLPGAAVGKGGLVD